MRFADVLGEDAPDPRLQWREQARHMPVPILGLIPQRHLEDWDAIGVGTETRNEALVSCEVSISYTFWRNPDEPTDPRNLAELDERQRHELEADPPWPRPPWLLEQIQQMRYPMLWECVRTRWCRDPDESDRVDALLVAHVNHILVNRFRPTPAVSNDRPYDIDGPVDERCVEREVPVLVDGVAREGVRIDTDPDVYGLGADIDANVVLTAAIPRDALPYLEVAFAVRPV